MSQLRKLNQEFGLISTGDRRMLINRLLNTSQTGGFKLPTNASPTLNGPTLNGLAIESPAITNRKGLKIVSLNILTPELFMYFWRSSYGLKLYSNDPSDQNDPNTSQKNIAYYNSINKQRIENIIKYLRSLKANIICLQEVTANTYDYLNSQTIQAYIADKLRMTVTSQAFKESPVQYDYPPTEQKRVLSADSGVATLASVDVNLKFVRTVMTANDFGPSKLFNSGVGSPFTVDEFVFHERKFYLANLHIRMQYPHIKLPLLEVYDHMASRLSKTELNNTIVIGDFNAHTLESAKDLFASKFYETMFDYQGHELIDDHVFFGNQIRDFSINVKYPPLPILEMAVNDPPTGLRWTLPTTRFKLSPLNNKLLSSGQLTTDHLPIIVDIDFETRALRRRSPSLIKVL